MSTADPWFTCRCVVVDGATWLAEARRMALPRRSGFRVGAVVETAEGDLALGFNLELGPATLHAEQAAVVRAWERGTQGIERLWVDAAPCGHCRQFLLEAHNPDLRVCFHGRSERLARLLPDPFTPGALGVHASPFGRPANLPNDNLEATARRAAARSHTPYTRASRGLAARLATGEVLSASTFESVAFNPSVPAVMSLYAQVLGMGRRTTDVAEVVLACTAQSSSEVALTRAVLAAEAPACTVREVDGDEID